MNVLEKILEEIEEKFKTADAEKCDCEELCDVEDWYDSGYIDGQLSAHEKCMDIIRSHMDEAKDINAPSNDDTEEKIREHIAECLHRIDNIRSFIGSKEYTSNDEKCIRNIEVLKTSITALEEYLSSKKKNGNDDWIPVKERLPEEGEKCIITDKYGYMRDGIIYDYADSKDDKPSFHRWDDEYWQCFRPDVIAWQPLPEPYRPKEKNNGK